MIFYLLFATLLIAMTYTRVAPVFVFIFLFLFSALRSGIGWDYYSYYSIIENTKVGFFDHNFERFSIFWKFLIDSSNELDEPQVFFIIASFLTIFFIYKGIRSERKKPELLICALFPMFYLASFSTIRHALAVSFVFYSLNYLKEKKIITWLLLVFLATYFHFSALISLLFIIPAYYPIKKTKYMLIMLVAVYILISTDILISVEYVVNNYLGQYSKYLEKDNFGSKITLLYIFIAFIFIYFRNKLIAKNENNRLYVDIYLYGVILVIVLSQFGSVLMRLSSYFLIFSIVVVPEISRMFTGKNKILVNLLTVFFLVGIFIGYLFLIKDTENSDARYVPYKTILQ